ncbi:FHA domain-containing protein [Ectothiorhodospira lacustris]|uniref:FHA domain-containing protein n=1 Tax=Ectothiorhodospira lacustris TaxID=2899127 RepID=UPI001EE84DC6|nr:FHA domain-containing protein [Ectothiorhodospira lacustris]MCG5499597.1 FHA domain-containing protein [Ectothiorhodospira lacustris]
MSRLCLSCGDTLIGEYPMGQKTLSIGRRPDNDIRLNNLAVSGYHAQVISLLNDALVEDLGSTNGTLVNGIRIRKRVLQEGDVIAIGNYQIRFTQVSAPREDNRHSGDETLILTSAPLPSPTPVNQATADAPVTGRKTLVTHPTLTLCKARVQILSGANAGRELPITKSVTTLGHPGVQVAAILRRGTDYYITHVEGGSRKTPPRLNGTDFTTQARPLRNHDIIDVAGVRMEFMMN